MKEKWETPKARKGSLGGKVRREEERARDKDRGPEGEEETMKGRQRQKMLADQNSVENKGKNEN